ncbi:hypothetical protein [Curtobacterium sp. MWU13-2055]|uniref:hypothetical protein n=1 Tax=Curtobacterium sp. MWU13-2055 TaxID=2931928 RepID=UPI00200D11DF|nr:hypothetical protein [Curtobacterium sp. MWU13-2055]
MDSGWAVVIGAAIALAGALITPLVIEPRRERARRAREARDEIARLVPEFFRYSLGHEEQVAGRQTEVLTRIRFLVAQKDDPIMRVLAGPSVVVKADRPAAIANATGVIARWLEGTYDAKRALVTYELARQIDPHGDFITDWAAKRGAEAEEPA